MTNNWEAEAVARIGAYIERNGPIPDKRSFPVYAATWHGWFDTTKLPERPRWSELALDVLSDLEPDEGVPAARDGRRIDRRYLLRLSQAAAADDSDDARVRLLFATMLWGSGTSNGRGPRYAAAALSDDRLVGVLRETAELVRSGDLAQAHRRFRVHGIGPSFLTKWFWALGLSTDARPRPLILDSIVAGTLADLSLRPWPLYGGGAPGRYVDYVRLLDEWSNKLPVSAEGIEQVLFEGAAALPKSAPSP